MKRVSYHVSPRGTCTENMHFLTSLIILGGFVFVICLGLLKLTRDLSEMSFHEAPELRESSPAEVSDAR